MLKLAGFCADLECGWRITIFVLRTLSIVFMCVYFMTPLCIVQASVCACVRFCLCAYLYLGMYGCACVCLYVCMLVYVRLRVYMCSYLRVHTCMLVCVHLCVCVHMRVSVRICVHMCVCVRAMISSVSA